jgi:hypothetical protein
MRTYAVVIRVLNKDDYYHIKAQAKLRGEYIKELSARCGLTYKQFIRYFSDSRDSTTLAEQLLAIGYELIERR